MRKNEPAASPEIKDREPKLDAHSESVPEPEDSGFATGYRYARFRLRWVLLFGFCLGLLLAALVWTAVQTLSPFGTSQGNPFLPYAEPRKLGADEMQHIRNAAAFAGFTSAGFVTAETTSPTFMFSDPTCTSCQDFERKLTSDGYQTFSPVKILVGFQPRSFEISAAVLCSHLDPHKAWLQAIEGTLDVEALVCNEGLGAVERNNAMFTAMGLGRTPAFVAGDGTVLEGARPLQTMREWSEQHAGTLGLEDAYPTIRR